jgi:hypothetical protein
MTSYIIKNGEVIAISTDELASGPAQAAHSTASSDLDANYDRFLVNAFGVTISNAKKWAARVSPETPFAAPLGPRQPRELLIRG